MGQILSLALYWPASASITLLERLLLGTSELCNRLSHYAAGVIDVPPGFRPLVLWPLVITPVHAVLEQPSANDLISLKTSSLNHWVASWALTLQWTKAVPRTWLMGNCDSRSC